MACRCTDCSGKNIPIMGQGGLAGALGQATTFEQTNGDATPRPTNGAQIDSIDVGNGETEPEPAPTNGLKINPLLLIGGGGVLLFLLTR